jgi:hypothetical protein
MFSGRHELPCHNKRVFIDRDGLSFTNMINYLRNGKFPIFKDKHEEISFYEELEFWQIPINEGSMSILTLGEMTIRQNLQFDTEWCASSLVLEQNNTLIKKNSKN